MANTILLKKNSTAGAAPTAGQLSAGELAINTADGRLFAKNSAGTVVNLPVTSISGQDITPNTVDTVSLGTVGAPAFSFSTDTDTGVYSPTANTWAVATGGTQRLRVNSSGGVAIGTASSWTSKLLVDSGSMPGTAQTEVFQVLDSSSSGDYINIGRFNVNRNSARGAFSLSNSGSGAWENNVMQFFVHGATYLGGTNGYYRGYDANSNVRPDAGYAMIVTQGSNVQGLAIGNYNNVGISFFTNHDEKVWIRANGNLGVGAETPQVKLHVQSDEDTAGASGTAMFLSQYQTDGTDAYWRGLTLSGASNLTVLSGCYLGMAAIGAHSWTNAATQNTPAWADLYVNPDGAANVYIGSTTGWTSGQGILTVSNSTGYVGIGTNTPTADLDVSGNVAISGQLDVDPSTAGQINCMYLNAGISAGGTVSTDTLYINGTITNTTYTSATIDFIDDNASPGFVADGNFGVTVYATSGASSGDEGPGSSGAIFSQNRLDGVVTTYRLQATAGIVSTGNSLRPGVQSPQTSLYLWQNFR